VKRKARGAAIVIGAQGEATLGIVSLLQPFFEDVLNVSAMFVKMVEDRAP